MKLKVIFSFIDGAARGRRRPAASEPSALPSRGSSAKEALMGRSHSSGQSDSGVEDERVLARGDVTAVERCACGGLYLTVGPVRMKLDPAVLPELARTIGAAARALGGAAWTAH